MKVRNFDEGKVIDLVHGFPPHLEHWTSADIDRAAAHVWEQIRLQTKDEITADLQTVFTRADMEPAFLEKLVYIMHHASENSRMLCSGETGERLQIPHRFADGRIVTFDLRMKSEAEVRQALLEAQQKTPEAVF